eukprot:CAMPEP_0175128808 /NCGR_PEP_ID=MMETSP0087-20121206/5132_1 /TAXON_ID=136419 /ORGANISM="Unknown Unknown, Strain D1" /LENGTH=319 /DNA_ID=CAMNT_0016410907 /DNA_START=8 /DNA_END=965 /DNA_ORIENTATION=+
MTRARRKAAGERKRQKVAEKEDQAMQKKLRAKQAEIRAKQEARESSVKKRKKNASSVNQVSVEQLSCLDHDKATLKFICKLLRVNPSDKRVVMQKRLFASVANRQNVSLDGVKRDFAAGRTWWDDAKSERQMLCNNLNIINNQDVNVAEEICKRGPTGVVLALDALNIHGLAAKLGTTPGKKRKIELISLLMDLYEEEGKAALVQPFNTSSSASLPDDPSSAPKLQAGSHLKRARQENDEEESCSPDTEVNNEEEDSQIAKRQKAEPGEQEVNSDVLISNLDTQSGYQMPEPGNNFRSPGNVLDTRVQFKFIGEIDQNG